MANPRKRIEAINEMFLSEKAYVSDLTLWESKFRKCILNFPFLSLKVKYEICDRVFLNMHEIKNKHEAIFNEMKIRNLEVRKQLDPNFINNDEDSFCIDKTEYDNPIVLKLEYATIFFKYSGAIYLYKDYFSRLPKAEYELERICHYSAEFKKGLEEFLTKNNIEYLGVRNFLYRPSTKLARLPLLLKAISKNEGNQEIKAQYELLIDKIKRMAFLVDNVFSEYGGQFKIYILSQRLKYDVTINKQLVLGLFQKKRKLYKEGDFLFKPDIWSLPILVRIYIFDHCIIFSEKSKGQFSKQNILFDPLFLERLIFFDVNLGFNKLEDEESNFFPLFLLDTSDNLIRTILFEDCETREIYKNTLGKALKAIRKKYKKNIKISKIDSELQNILCACKTNKFLIVENTESSSESSNEEEEEIIFTAEKLLTLKEFQNAIREYSQKIERNSLHMRSRLISFRSFTKQNDEDEDSEDSNNENLSWIKSLCYKKELINHVFDEEIYDNTENQEYIKNQEDMLIVSTKNGIYSVLKKQYKMIYKGTPKKVLYDTKYELLMFQISSTLFVCKYNHEMNSINPVSLKINVGDFFYGTNTKGSFIATRNYGSSKSSLIFLFQVSNDAKKIKINLSRKLYVGFKVYNLIFCPTKIVIACKDFEIVDMETLKTEEFLELYNPCVPMLLSMVPNSKAMSVFTINFNTFLVCFNSVGFYSDKFGKIKNTDIIFIWKNIPLDFKLHNNRLIVLSKSWIDIFDINNGSVIFTEQVSGLKFVNGTQDVILHDDNNFYKIFIQ